MTIPTTGLHLSRAAVQIEQNLVGLQRDVRNNASAWQAQASAQSIPLSTLQGYIASAISAYRTRLGWVTTIMADSVHWPLISAMWGKLGGSDADTTGILTPLSAAVSALAAADVSSYAAIETACAALIAAVPAPLSLWPE